MAADFDKPTITGDAYVDVLGEIRAQFEVVSTMSYGDALNTKTGAVQFLDGAFQKWDGASFKVAPISISGGGTGASSVVDARTALQVPSVTEVDAGYLSKDGNLTGIANASIARDTLDVPSNSETLLKSDSLSGIASPATAFNTIKQSATSGTTGVVKIIDSLTSSATDTALTANQGRILNNNRNALLTLFGQLSFSFKADWTGSDYNVVDITGDQSFWEIQSSNVNKVSFGKISVAIPAAVSTYSVQVTAVNASPGFNVCVGDVTSSSFSIYCRRIDTGALTDTDVFVTITRTETLG